jgi:hypothetical protein
VNRLVALDRDQPLPPLAQGGLPPLEAAERERHAPDRHLLCVDAAGALTGRASCWWTAAPPLPGERVGLIGHYAAADGASADTILGAACDTLAAAGCTIAIGPMDGNTWRRYRWIIERGTEPPFFLEPDNPDSAHADFVRGGFAIDATYFSGVTDDLTRVDPRLARLESRLVASGVAIRPLDRARGRDELRAIFRLSLEAFKDNYLYTPIAEAEFLEQNERVLPYVDPRLVLLAERDGALAGYLFAVPDVLQRLRGGTITTAIVKTVAVAAGRALSGLGTSCLGSEL